MGIFTAYLCSTLLMQYKARFWGYESLRKIFEISALDDP
jgi:hypothetical protein